MLEQKSKPVSARVSFQTFAKVLDGLIAKGVPARQLMSNSNIVKTALLMIVANSPNPIAPASQESINTIKQLWKVTKREKKIDLESLENLEDLY